MEKMLSILLANFVVLQYKIHSIHTSMKDGLCWLGLHAFLDDVYLFFGDENIDKIKERAEIKWSTTPFTLSALLEIASIDELTKLPSTIEAKQIILEDLKHMEDILSGMCPKYADDLVTQNMLVDFKDQIGIFRWKLESTKYTK